MADSEPTALWCVGTPDTPTHNPTSSAGRDPAPRCIAHCVLPRVFVDAHIFQSRDALDIRAKLLTHLSSQSLDKVAAAAGLLRHATRVCFLGQCWLQAAVRACSSLARPVPLPITRPTTHTTHPASNPAAHTIHPPPPKSSPTHSILLPPKPTLRTLTHQPTAHITRPHHPPPPPPPTPPLLTPPAPPC